jgi:hypothetical protein
MVAMTLLKFGELIFSCGMVEAKNAQLRSFTYALLFSSDLSASSHLEFMFCAAVRSYSLRSY